MLVSLNIFIEFWKFDKIELLRLKFTLLFGSLEPVWAAVATAG